MPRKAVAAIGMRTGKTTLTRVAVQSVGYHIKCQPLSNNVAKSETRKRFAGWQKEYRSPSLSCRGENPCCEYSIFAYSNRH